MSTFDDLEPETAAILDLLLDVLSGVLGEEALEAGDRLEGGAVAISRIAVHDELSEAYALVEVRVGIDLARVLASRMMSVASPTTEDVLDSIAELGNIAGGNLKSLLCEHARLSLPSAVIADHAPPDVAPDVHVFGVVLGHLAELTVHAADGPAVESEGFSWPPGQLDELLERSR